MAQTTESVWGGAAKVEIGTSTTSFTDISGHANLVDSPLVERRQGEAYTFDGEDPIVKVGKKQSIQIPVQIIYTEGASDAFEKVRAQYEAAGGGAMYLRWCPEGATVSGQFNFLTDQGFIQAFQYPPVNAEEDGPMMLSFQLQCASITKGTYST
jgi:hypothetical protein